MAVTQHYALSNFWYWQYRWLDMLMHFSGGVVIGLALYAAFGRRMAILYGVLIVGALWEVFEYVLGISLVERNFAFDTTKDLTMDLVGGLAVYGIMGGWIHQLLSRSSAGPVELPDQTSL